MLPGDTAELRKARGAFFTPPEVARFVTRWAVRNDGDAVIEPSCGEAVFLHEAPQHQGPLVGVELHEASARAAERTLRAKGIPASIHVGDFFAHQEFGQYDAAIGNPPYVRYQGWTGEARSASRAAALRAGVNLTKLASSWAAFTVHAALHLKAGGRLGLVLPAELLTVNYAAPVRRFLLEHFSEVSLILFEERVFPGVEVEALLLLADGYDPSGGHGRQHVKVHQLRDASGLTSLGGGHRWAPSTLEARWSAGLLSPAALDAFGRATVSSGFVNLETWGDTTLGMVTGNNRFFALSPEKVADLDLRESDVIRLSPPGSRHLRSLTLTAESLTRLGEQGMATYLFRPEGEPSAGAWKYIQSGKDLDVHLAYKCSVRTPWWRVPYLRPADLFLTYMNADTPRIATNRARAHHLNSVHGIYLRSEVRGLGMGILPIGSLNTVTLLGAETVGRAYGGGMLKIEPREADLLPVPAPAVLEEHREALHRMRPWLAARLRKGQLMKAVEAVDDVILVRGQRMSKRALSAMRADHANLTARRVARSKDSARG